MNSFHEIVRKWRDAPDLTPDEKRKIIEQELAWAEEEEKRIKALRSETKGQIIALACAAVNRAKTN
jgi:hypothetical protein